MTIRGCEAQVRVARDTASMRSIDDGWAKLYPTDAESRIGSWGVDEGDGERSGVDEGGVHGRSVSRRGWSDWGKADERAISMLVEY